MSYQDVANEVFPMYVGVIQLWETYDGSTASIPHVCGGDPYQAIDRLAQRQVFPMYVGVIL